MNYLKYILPLYILITCFTEGIKAQEEPEFSFPVYFEDAVGNKDTIIIGYDHSVKESKHPYEEFGEYAITEPFDSVFEVRCVPEYIYDTTMMKTLIVEVEDVDQGIIVSAFCGIYVRAKYPPVTVSYDSSLFQNTPLSESFFTRDYGVVTLFPHLWDDIITVFYCAEKQSSFQDSFLVYNLLEEHPSGFFRPIQMELPVEGYDELQPVAGMFFTFTPFPFLKCREGVSTEKAQLFKSLVISPNPVHSSIQFSLPTAGEWTYEIYNSQGKLMKVDRITSRSRVEIQVSFIDAAGIYFIRVIDGKQYYIGRFVKE